MQKLKLKLKKAKIEGITLKWVENVISAGVSNVANNYFSIYEQSGSPFASTAINFIEDYSYKDKTTVWVIDADGVVISSSSGFKIKKQATPVDDSYFSDAVFIGDSRVEGFHMQSGITQGTFLTGVGMNCVAM